VTHASTFVGTPCYTAPERLLGRPYDERSDIYSVGLLLHLAFRGELPFGSDPPNFPEMVRLHLTTKPMALTDEAPAAIAAIVNQMLDFDPAARPPLRDVASALRASSSLSGA
jgi:serine/threonine protein kinase